MRGKPLISIIISNFNGETYLGTCLDSILQSSYGNFEVVLVDDGSSDKSIEIIKEFQKGDKRVRLLRNTKNKGAAASRNKAIKMVRGRILVFLDNDTEVKKDWLTELAKPLQRKKDIGGAQAVLLDFKNRDLIQMAGGLLIPHVGWLAPFYQWQRYSQVKKSLKEQDIVAISAALAVKKEIIDKIGGFDEKEKVYTEDVDFCWRIWLTGYRIILAPDSIVYHWTKPVEARAGMRATHRQIYFHLAKNSIRSIFKNYEIVNIIKYLPYSVVINLGRGILVLLRRKKLDALFGTLAALVWNLFNLPNTIAERQKVQKIRKRSDLDLFSKVATPEAPVEIYRKYFSQTNLIRL